jgi:hypothetical protein
MSTRSRLIVVGFVVYVLIAVIGPRSVDAQSFTRWVADPEMIAPAKPYGSGAAQVPDQVYSMKLISATDGWAVTYGSVLRFDGRWWRRQIALAPTTFLDALSVVSPTNVWVAGYEQDTPAADSARILLARIDPRTNALNRVTILGKDGTSSQQIGMLSDLAVFAGSAIAVGQVPSDVQYWSRPLVVTWDGTQWRDTTPAAWHYGYLSAISMVSPTEGWATGLLGRPGGQGDDALRPVIVHVRDGQWIEEALPSLPISSQPFSMGQIVMRDAGEGWATFRDAGTLCGNAKLLHFRGGTWITVDHEYASSIGLGLIPGTNRGWISLGGCTSGTRSQPNRLMRFEDGVMTPVSGGSQRIPQAFALLNDQVQWAAAGGAMLRNTADPLPTDRAIQVPKDSRYFAETGHTLAGEFRAYYETHGLELGDRNITPRESLGLFGYPISEPFDEINPDTGQILRVQYFERARMELHPENQPPFRVLLGRLAAGALFARAGVEAPESVTIAPTCLRFNETGRTLCPPIRAFWQRSGGLPVFGLALTSARDQQNASDGKTYLTQWFERERLEYHPELRGTPYEVLLGLMGSEELRVRGYLP